MIAPDAAGTVPIGGAPPAPAREPRFTLDGDDALERHLGQTCARVLSGIRGLVPARRLEAVLLGGGYGRGEGGVLRGPAGDRPYNDLEFYVAIRGSRHLNELRYHRRLDVLGEILSHLADAEIEFKITSLAEMAFRPVSMFSYDLAAGHRRLWGPKAAGTLPGCDPSCRAREIPPAEAARLLMNRCSGLLFARVELGRKPFTPAAADFTGRNIAKVQLACGDAALAAIGQYHWSCLERHRRLERLALAEPSPWLDAVLAHHRTGVEFKLHPAAGGLPQDALEALHGEVAAMALQCWLRLEGVRLGRAFASARSYAEDQGDQCPESSPRTNLLLNLRSFGLRLQIHPSPWRHPRQRIFRSMALLLWEPSVFADPALRMRLEAELNFRGQAESRWIPAYLSLWRRIR